MTFRFLPALGRSCDPGCALGRRRTNGSALTGWYGQADVGFEFRHLLPWSSGRSQWDVGLFVVYRRYFEDDRSESVTYAAVAPDPDATPDSLGRRANGDRILVWHAPEAFVVEVVRAEPWAELPLR